MMRLVVLALGLLPALALSSEDAQHWLDRMSQAVQTLDYEGTFVYSHNGKMETMKIVHTMGPEGPREHLISLSGEAREMIRDRGILTCVWPGSRSVVVEQSRSRVGMPQVVSETAPRIADNYVLSVGESERVAGMPCRIVDVRPRDAFRFGYRLCIAEENGMLLKSLMVDEAGNPIEQLMFTSIAFDGASAAERETPPTSGAPVAEGRTYPVDEGWRLTALPPGFVLRSVVSRPMHRDGEPVQQMIVSDGLASVSVFIAEPAPDQQYYQGVTDTGALHAFARVHDGHQITVVGEVPEATVRLIGTGLVHADEQP